MLDNKENVKTPENPNKQNNSILLDNKMNVEHNSSKQRTSYAQAKMASQPIEEELNMGVVLSSVHSSRSSSPEDDQNSG